MSDLTTSLNTVQQNFATYDTAAKGGDKDGLISRQDLQAVADGAQYTPEQRAAARYFLDNPEKFDAVEIADKGGEQDGLMGKGDVDKARTEAPLYGDTSTFDTTEPTVSYQYPDPRPSGDDPQSVAKQTQADRQDGQRSDVGPNGTFTRAVQEHKNDPAWLQQYFRALGSKQTAEYLSTMTDWIVNSSATKSDAAQIIADERTALQNMYASGALNDADISRLVESWARQSGDPRSAFPQMIAGMDGPQAPAIKNAFAQACAELSVTGQSQLNGPKYQFTSDAGKWLSDGDRNQLAAGAAFVLASTDSRNQANQLLQLRKEGGDGAVSNFFSHAMAVDTQTYGLTALTTDGAQRSGEDPNVPYAGAADLIKSLANADPSTLNGTKSDLMATRDAAFYSAAQALDDHSDQWESSKTLKDGLSKVFRDDYDSLINQAVAPNGAALDDDGPLPAALENFAQHVLFTDPSGAERDQTSKFLVDKLSTTINDINTMSSVDFKAKYGRDQTQMAHLSGEILGHVNNGMEQAVKVAGDKYQAKKNSLDFALNLAWSLGQDGIKLLPGGSTVSAILPDSIKNSATFGTIKDQVITDLKSGASDKAAALLLDKFPDLHADQTLTGLSQELSEVVKANNGEDYLSSLLSSYDTVNASPADSD